MAFDLTKSIRYVKGVGERRARLFEKLGIADVGALLRFYPRTYQDWNHPLKIREAPLDTPCCVAAKVVVPPTEHIARSGMKIYKATVSDGQDEMEITIFNSKYAAARLKRGEEYLFYGKVSGSFLIREMTSPEFEKAGAARYIRPIYRQTKGLTTKIIEGIIRAQLKEAKGALPDPIPAYLREKYKLPALYDALCGIHFPKTWQDVTEARRRLIFEELLILQLALQSKKIQGKRENSARVTQNYAEEFASLLPFTLTGAQKRCIDEAISDMMGDTPMSRLLQGDVGSGKTAVAAALCYTVAKNGYQAAIMVPTEILAEQHYAFFKKLEDKTKLNTALLTGSLTLSEKRRIKEALKSGQIDLVVGTHALITSDVAFKSLGLVVTDEQHRFGVSQRGALATKGENPHTLVMSATPIPRTLALIIYGDLDISILDELPPGRQQVKTYIITGDLRQRCFNFIKKHIHEGRQAFIVCPLIEDSEDTELISAVKYAEELERGPFSGYKTGLLHGQMKASEKEQVMRAFLNREIDLLVSTTVIETGIDVPNATVMVVENAERFGLSQLHQLRGRVGRGKHQSYCILISDAKGEDTLRRLEVMRSTTDGFIIAEQDLSLRGPGEFFGNRQHGLPELKIANLATDMRVLKEAQRVSIWILENDPALEKQEHKELSTAVNSLFSKLIE